jgi:hypothetical protein
MTRFVQVHRPSVFLDRDAVSPELEAERRGQERPSEDSLQFGRVMSELDTLITVIENAFVDALISLRDFDRAADAWIDLKGQWARNDAAHARLIAEAEQREPIVAEEHPQLRTIRLAAATRSEIARGRWDEGDLPLDCATRTLIVYARSFIHALAQISRALATMQRSAAPLPDRGKIRDAAADALDDLEASLPGLKPVRDSVEHAEDRIRGFHGHGRKKEPLPVVVVSQSPTFDVPTNVVLFADTIRGRSYGWTTANGIHEEVEISDASLETTRAAIQSLFDGLPWMRSPGDGKATPS